MCPVDIKPYSNILPNTEIFVDPDLEFISEKRMKYEKWMSKSETVKQEHQKKIGS